MSSPQKLDDDEAVFGSTAADQPTTEPSEEGLVDLLSGHVLLWHQPSSSAACKSERCVMPPTHVEDRDDLLYAQAHHQAEVLGGAGLLASAPQPAADTEPMRFDDWERRFRTADADANALAERVVKAEEEAARLDAVVTAVREVHRYRYLAGDAYLTCDGCGYIADDEDDLCPTRRALDGGAS